MRIFQATYFRSKSTSLHLLIGLGVLLLAQACSTGKKALEQGNYDEAINIAINRLKSNDDSKKASSTLKKAYSYSLELHQNNIAALENSVDPYKWDKLVGEYEILNGHYNSIQKCPGCRTYISNPVSFSRELQDAKLDAANARYAMGLEAMKMKDRRDKAIEAHAHFDAASGYVPRFKDSERLKEDALYYAILRVVIEPIPAPSKVFQLNQEFFYNKIMEAVQSRNRNPYVQFYTPAESESQKLEWINHVIQMEFERFTLGSVKSHTYVEELSKDSVVVAKKDGEDVFGTVKATLTINEKSLLGSGLLDFRVDDLESNRILTQEKFPSEYEWKVKWATFNGDERALSAEQKDLVKIVNFDVPGPQRMFEEFTQPLFEQVVNKIDYYYREF